MFTYCALLELIFQGLYSMVSLNGTLTNNGHWGVISVSILIQARVPQAIKHYGVLKSHMAVLQYGG